MNGIFGFTAGIKIPDDIFQGERTPVTQQQPGPGMMEQMMPSGRDDSLDRSANLPTNIKSGSVIRFML